MMFVLSVLLFGLVHCAEQGVELAPPQEVQLEAPDDAELDPVMLEIFAQNNTNLTALGDDSSSLADIKSLVSSMTKGDAKLTAFIIKKLLELAGKTRAEHKVINARVARKLATKRKEVAAKVVQDKKTALATAAYAAEVINSKYERMQVNRELKALDRIMMQLNAMSNWKSCPAKWKQFGRSCYTSLKRYPAYLAQGACLKQGGSLIRVDNGDDNKAVKWYGKYKDAYLILGFFRSLKTGGWQYLNGQQTNPCNFFSGCYGGTQNNRAYNYARYYKGYNKIQGCYYTWQGAPLCEHRLAVNLKK